MFYDPDIRKSRNMRGRSGYITLQWEFDVPVPGPTGWLAGYNFIVTGGFVKRRNVHDPPAMQAATRVNNTFRYLLGSGITLRSYQLEHCDKEYKTEDQN